MSSLHPYLGTHLQKLVGAANKNSKCTRKRNQSHSVNLRYKENNDFALEYIEKNYFTMLRGYVLIFSNFVDFF